MKCAMAVLVTKDRPATESTKSQGTAVQCMVCAVHQLRPERKCHDAMLHSRAQLHCACQLLKFPSPFQSPSYARVLRLRCARPSAFVRAARVLFAPHRFVVLTLRLSLFTWLQNPTPLHARYLVL